MSLPFLTDVAHKCGRTSSVYATPTTLARSTPLRRRARLQQVSARGAPRNWRTPSQAALELTLQGAHAFAALAERYDQSAPPPPPPSAAALQSPCTLSLSPLSVGKLALRRSLEQRIALIDGSAAAAVDGGTGTTIGTTVGTTVDTSIGTSTIGSTMDTSIGTSIGTGSGTQSAAINVLTPTLCGPSRRTVNVAVAAAVGYRASMLIATEASLLCCCTQNSTASKLSSPR